MAQERDVEHARDSRLLRSLPANSIRQGRKDPESLALRLRSQSADRLAERQRLVAIESQTLCDYGSP